MKSAMATLALLLIACNGKLPAADAPKVSVTGQEKVKDDFEKDNPKWKFAEGRWVRRNGVLAQTSETQPWAVALLEDKKFADVDVSVKGRPLSGKEDQSAGLLFRAKDSKNYYLVRSNGLEDNFRLYSMVDGNRKQIASAKVDPPKVGEWHTIRVVAKGKNIQAYIGDKLLIDHEDGTFSEGYVGLWTKADSVTEFDDFQATGAR